ncbi:MFS transporter [Microbacterium trichothecenolyticum]|uniref:Sugar efflux transporter B n=1 Tax=Microbacterium trichothecenolyticum TaxID=69370 RepID=A0A0M2H943_MICTR|nr:MFS transporter [Microbacterium trichothecenolyticum]KJL42941.1 Sugar efflux transporter B [Microbacterium trichothecenolyticum]
MTSSTASVTLPGTSVSRFPLGALLLLSLGVFVTVTAESLPAGLMPEMARDFGVDPLRIGLLVSVWAVVVIATSIPLTRATRRIDRRIVVAVSLAVFALANVATAFAPTYEFAFATRAVAAVAHGVFWAIVIVYASSLLSGAQLGRGLALVTGGGTAATVLGLPVATALAQLTSWRVSFAVMGIGMLMLAAVVFRRLPRSVVEPVPAAERAPLRHDRSLPPLVAFGIAGLLIGLAQFLSFVYIRPYLAESAGVADGWASALLFVFGAAGMAGVAVAGSLADRFPRTALTATLLVFVVAFASLAIAPHATFVVVVALALWGAGTGAMFPLIQTALMRAASDRLRDLASASIVVLFNVGIAGGSWAGGQLTATYGPTANMAVSAVVVLVAAGLTAAGSGLAARRQA